MRCEGCKHYLKGGSACGLCYCYDRFEPKDYPPYLDYPKERKPLTNYDRLVSKSPEEMAIWINSHFTCPPKTTCPMGEASCEKCWLDWLRKEADHDDA